MWLVYARHMETKAVLQGDMNVYTWFEQVACNMLILKQVKNCGNV